MAIGKLNLVVAPGRSPRLVVDSSVSGVTANTCIPNRMALPRISDVIFSAPDTPTSEACVLLTLDVSKAHRRIKIHPDDRGLLCFHVQKRLFRSNTLNFGARASGYYWGRVAGMLMRTLHRVVHVRHSMFIYVDDLVGITGLDVITSLCSHGRFDVHVLGCSSQLEEDPVAIKGGLDWMGNFRI